MTDKDSKSWFSRTLGRSLISVLFGNFFEKKNNSAALIAIMLVGTLCYVLIYTLVTGGDISKGLAIISNVIFVVIGYYFGSKQEHVKNDDDE